MGVLHSFSIKNIFYDKMDLKLFYFHVTIHCPFILQNRFKKEKVIPLDLTFLCTLSVLVELGLSLELWCYHSHKNFQFNTLHRF